uniref:Uncharacterized protein n=1 Tax=Lygus hesperus TaxID=30085 RepID=A0A146LN00_LYGHE
MMKARVSRTKVANTPTNTTTIANEEEEEEQENARVTADAKVSKDNVKAVTPLSTTAPCTNDIVNVKSTSTTDSVKAITHTTAPKGVFEKGTSLSNDLSSMTHPVSVDATGVTTI